VPNVIGIIPARYQSKRFPGKPLALIAGVPLVVRVIQAAQKSNLLSEVIVATDDQRIADMVCQYNGRVILTTCWHATGSDRIAEAAADLDCDYLINIQGDEPFISAEVIDTVIRLIEAPDVVMSSACAPILEQSEAFDPNVVKVVLDQFGNALYFSRSAIPYSRHRESNSADMYRHIGIYGFKRDFLFKFASLKRTPLELGESLEQLRALEYGYKIRMAVVKFDFVGIDCADDLIKAEDIFRKRGLK
jgi:3-deoxy-manno-octulosonate cytidylyltransferase (CMP-KDO synthetase)